MRLSRAYIWLIAATVLGALLMFINQRFWFAFIPHSDEFLGALGLTVIYGVIGLGCAAALENGRAPRLMRSGMSIGLIALCCWIAQIFSPPLQESLLPFKAFMWPTMWACLMMFAGLLLLLPMRRGWRGWMRTSTIVMLALLAAFIAGAFTLYPDVSSRYGGADWQWRRDYEETAMQIGVALALFTAASLATTLIIGLHGALSGEDLQPPAIRLTYWLKCPRCGREQNALTGDHFCIACNLRTRITEVG